jgi:hypothetical protein
MEWKCCGTIHAHVYPSDYCSHAQVGIDWALGAVIAVITGANGGAASAELGAGTLSAVCCLLSAVCCLLSAVCCLLSAVCCLLSAVCY